MSGHSHWATIKHKKGAEDAKRSKVFSKMANIISVAVKEKGGDPETNPTLRMAIDKAKNLNMPKDNIERAIKKGSGELKGVNLENVCFEAYGPGGIAVIIEGITDNKNRTISELKQILNQCGGKMVGEGAVSWMFEKKGVITPKEKMEKTKEDIEMAAIESGADDIGQNNGSINIYTKIEDLEKVKVDLEKKGIKIESASLEWVAKEEISIDEKNRKTAEKLFEALDDNEDVQEIYSNLS